MFKNWFRDLKELIADGVMGLIRSRSFWLGALFLCMTFLLVFRLFQLQILEGANYQESYIQKTLNDLTLSSTRGRIFDCNGKLLADNQPAYAVTIKSDFYKTNAELNQTILEVIHILEKQGETLETTFPVTMGEDGLFSYTFRSETTKLRFFRDDVFSAESIDALTDEQKAITAQQVYERFKLPRLYGLTTTATIDGASATFTGWLDPRTKEPVMISEEDALKIVNVRYAMRVLTYNKSQSVTIASQVSNATVAIIKENTDQYLGVDVEQKTVRVYPDSVYFSHIIGYTGTASLEDIDTFNQQLTENGAEEKYKSGDVVGRSGLEQKLELSLQGEKGKETAYMDSQGRILEVADVVDPVNGNDVQLSIDKELQTGVYHILEQELAGILIDKLVDGEFTPPVDEKLEAALWQIPVKDVYFQLINNNILSLAHFSAEDASETEQAVYQKFTDRQTQALAALNAQLTTSPLPKNQLDEELASYMDYVYSYLISKGVIVSAKIDKTDAVYVSWTNEELSLKDFLYHAIEQNWIDSTQITSDLTYSNTEQIYNSMITMLLTSLPDNKAFSKVIYDVLIHGEVISGNELCLALFDQGVLEYDASAIAALTAGGHAEAFQFIREKIRNLELTPAQIALDPCSGSIVITDVNTGKIKAMVTYPGYDNNKMSGKVDASYYTQLTEDLSSPFLNNATQVSMAPGSTFKMVTASAGLGEGVIDLNTKINCTIIYDKITPSPSCWKHTDGGHGELSVVDAIANSCNFFFYEVGYRLCLDPLGQFNEQLGLDRLKKYAEMFGFSEKSGVEVNETGVTQISDSMPIPSAIGQGTNAFSPIQMARYVTAIASSGNLYELSLLENQTNAAGEVVETYDSKIESEIDLPQQTWNILQEGMYSVVYDGTITGYFDDLNTKVAGKTGTAQENLSRADHAQFVSYAPYNDPEISVVTMIPHGYTSGYTAATTKNVYKYYFGQTTLDEILSGKATENSNSAVVGD